MAEITPEQYQARTDAINAEAAAMQAQSAAMQALAAAQTASAAAMREATAAMDRSDARREPDEDLWKFYAAARACSAYPRTDAEVNTFANDMLKRHRLLFPK